MIDLKVDEFNVESNQLVTYTERVASLQRNEQRVVQEIVDAKLRFCRSEGHLRWPELS